MRVIEQQLAECKNRHFYMQKLLEKQGNHGTLEQIRTECHMCFDNKDYRKKINKFLEEINDEFTKNRPIKSPLEEQKSAAVISDTNNNSYVRLTDAERYDILKGFVQKIAGSQDYIPPEFEEYFRENLFSLFSRS